MLKKMKTRKGADGYNYPYTHQDLIFNDEGTGLSQQLENKVNKSDLKTVATSGSYNDLTDKPNIPSVQGLATEEFVNNMLSGLRLVQMTQSEYDALEVKDSNTLYIII